MSIIDLNRLAMHYLSREGFTECFHLLKQAETVLELAVYEGALMLDAGKRARMLSLTLNNFGCYYKKVGKPNVALSYMLRALAIESKET
jgi:hypothetical protein